MSGAKFNPGPWRISAAGVMSSVGVDGGGTVVCEAPIRYLESRRNWDNNAPLIAAAPDLYEALRALLVYQCYDQMPRTEEDCASFGRSSAHAKMLIAATHALAKAEGRS